MCKNAGGVSRDGTFQNKKNFGKQPGQNYADWLFDAFNILDMFGSTGMSWV